MLREPLTLILAQIVVIIAAARAVGLLARRLHQPMVIAEVVAGILLGPSFLGWLLPEVSQALFPHTSLPVLQTISVVGLVLFMFLIGLELDPGLLSGRGRASLIISHTSIVVPFGLGALLASYLYPRFAGSDVPFVAFALFMGVAMSITAFPVLARILSESGLLRSRLGAVTIACAAVDDVTAWCILAFVVTVVRAAAWSAGLFTTACALLYVIFMVLLVRPLMMRLSARIRSNADVSQNILAVLLLLTFTSACITELIGIHALFGAFLFGALFPKGSLANALRDKLEELVLVVLLPLFFAYSGLRTHIGLLDSPASWIACGLVLAVACAGKFGGAAVAARLTGSSWREASAIGILMNTRGLMELIVLNIGLDLGVISPTVFTMMVLMALATTFMTTPLLGWVYGAERRETEVGGREAERVDLSD